MRNLSILGCRGIPGNYGGFETFAERLALYLESQGWSVTVYCEDYKGDKISEKYWNNIRLVNVPVPDQSAKSSLIFDWKSTLHAAKEGNLILTLGYNTAVFCLWYRLKGLKNVINMDGLEWRRQKWSKLERLWLFFNERMGSWLGNHLVADHPEIKSHLAEHTTSSKITTIPYGAPSVEHTDPKLLDSLNLKPYEYSIIIARPEPENNILEIVSSFSKQTRGTKLVVLGNYRPETNAYHKQVMNAASDEVIFPGGIYHKPTVEALRFYTKLYIHGHSVGGTNPSLVEALAAGSPVLAHKNRFNRWVLGSDYYYFSDEQQCTEMLNNLLDDESALEVMRARSFERHKEEFLAIQEVESYKDLLEKIGDPSIVIEEFPQPVPALQDKQSVTPTTAGR